MADSPYPELKKSHTMARTGRPFADHRPPPAAPVWDVIEGYGRFHVLVSALELGVFDVLDADGASTADDLAGRVGASGPHLETLLEGVVALGFLERRGDTFALTDTANRYLVSSSPASMADLVAVAPGPLANWTRLTDTVRRGAPARPIEDDPASFYVPLVEATFATIHRCATRADVRLRYSALDRPRVLELGAGGAPWAIAVLAANPGARAVINDLDVVADVARRKVAEHGVAERCSFRPGDFHSIDVEPGLYDLVVLGHVCRTEGVDGARHLIERAQLALRPGGRLLLADYFCDERRSHATHALMMGVTMMASTRAGGTFTFGEVSTWLGDAGFRPIRLIEPIGFQCVFVATKPPPAQRADPLYENGDER